MYSQEPNIKRKNQSPLRVIVNVWGCMLAVIMLGLGAGMGVLASIFVGPQLLGFDQTVTALANQDDSFATNQANLNLQLQNANSTATAFSFDSQSTVIYLQNEQTLIEQTATRSSDNVIATNTAIVRQNAQRQTQVANDFIGTQSALEANATQVNLDFRNTQTALGIDVATNEPNLAITAPAPERFTFNLRDFDLSNPLWTLSVGDWSAGDSGLVAQNNHAWLTTGQVDLADVSAYTVDVYVQSIASVSADYWVIFSLQDTDGLAIHIDSNLLTVTEVGLYRFNAELLQNEVSLETNTMTQIDVISTDIALPELVQFTLQVNDNAIAFSIDDDLLLTSDDVVVAAGRIGVELPAQASLSRIDMDIIR